MTDGIILFCFVRENKSDSNTKIYEVIFSEKGFILEAA